MEELLNKLIEKGWKPRGEETKRLNYHTLYREVISLEFDNYNLGVSYSIRDLVSKESGLWQFVCENGMIRKKRCGTNWEGENVCFNYQDYEYWLIYSALYDEDKLEEFLLDNIKIDEVDKR